MFLCIYTDVNYRESNVLLLLTVPYCLNILIFLFMRAQLFLNIITFFLNIIMFTNYNRSD